MASLRFFALQIECNGNTWSYVLSEAHAVEADRDWRKRGAKVTSSPALPVVRGEPSARALARERAMLVDVLPKQTNAPPPGVGRRGARTGDRFNCQGEAATASRSKHAKGRASTTGKR